MMERNGLIADTAQDVSEGVARRPVGVQGSDSISEQPRITFLSPSGPSPSRAGRLDLSGNCSCTGSVRDYRVVGDASISAKAR